MKTKNIQQEVFFEASPTEVYQALMDSKIHSKFTGEIADIGKNVGEKFSTFNGYATGENLELKPNNMIVQSWRASDWPNEHYSTVRFELIPYKNGTLLKFHQTNIPEEQLQDINDGWQEYYWKPMKAMFKNYKKKNVHNK
jgi:activator of HSP90 ATPase